MNMYKLLLYKYKDFSLVTSVIASIPSPHGLFMYGCVLYATSQPPHLDRGSGLLNYCGFVGQQWGNSGGTPAGACQVSIHPLVTLKAYCSARLTHCAPRSHPTGAYGNGHRFGLLGRGGEWGDRYIRTSRSFAL